VKKVWFRKQTGWWCASIKEGGTYRQFKLVKAPNDKDGRKLAEAQLIQELAAKQPAEDGDPAPGWMTVAHVLNAFLKHSQGEHEPATARWYADLITPFRDLWGKLRVTQLRKKHVKR